MTSRVVLRCLALGIVVHTACGGGLGEPDREHVSALFELDARRMRSAPTTDAQRGLGERLFEHRFAGGSCVDCHPRDRLGHDGAVHGRATPALADVARQVVFGWDGLAADLPTIVHREIVDRLGVGDDAAFASIVARDAELTAAFAAAHGDARPTLERAVGALAAWLETWRSRGRWDDYVEGDDAALDAAERHGLSTFVAVGCAACHGGRNLGGASVHLLGLAEPFASADRGRELATGLEKDRHVFRAPMLRHAVRTAPYLHDGSIARLDDAVRLMARHELGRALRDDEVAAIVAFLAAVGDVDRP